jgi:hypothetical protein
MTVRRFLYQAHGTAVAGSITQPFRANIDVNSATSLPIVGGFAAAKNGPYKLNEVVSFENAHTHVSGIETPTGVYNSVVTCVVEGLNILHVVTADRIIGRLSVKHQEGEPAEIVPIGSSFENLRIGGQPVHVDLNHELFVQNPTHAGLVKYFEGNKSGKKVASVRYHWGAAGTELPARLEKGMSLDPKVGWHKSTHGVLHTSMVKQVQTTSPNGAGEGLPYGYAIHIPHVGDLYLAELFSSADTKRLTMLRLELGCPFEGVMAAAVPAGNGGFFP